MSKTTVWVILGFILGVGVIAVYMVSNPRPSVNQIPVENSAETEEVEEDALEKDTLEVTVKMSEYMFSPSIISIDTHEDIVFNLKNLGFTTHSFVVEELGINSGVIPPGVSKTITFSTEEPGEYEFYCNIGSHRDNGMEGVLIVK